MTLALSETFPHRRGWLELRRETAWRPRTWPRTCWAILSKAPLSEPVSPSEQAGGPPWLLKPAEREGPGHRSLSAIQTVAKVAAQSAHASSSANPALSCSVAFISPHKGAQGGPSGGLERAAAFAGMPSVSCPQMPHAQTSKFLHCLGVGVGEGAQAATCPNLDLASISPFRTGPRERRRSREKPLKYVSRSVCSAITSR